MLLVDADHKKFLVNAVQDGEAILVLGAGASASSTNRAGSSVAQSSKLAERIALAAGIDFNNERLSQVLGAVQGSILSLPQIIDIYKKEFQGVMPGNDLLDLFTFVWKRVYSLNIDDSVDRIGRKSRQSIRIFNGLAGC